MADVDERIARIRLKKRIENIEENKKEEDIEEKTLLDVIREMKDGEVCIDNKKIQFTEKSYLNNRITINIPIGYMEENLNEENNVTLTNELYGLSFVANYSEFDTKIQEFNEFKKSMIQQFKNNELDMTWLDDGNLNNGEEKIPYGIYKTSTSKGDLFNIIFYKTNKKSMLVGNYNCYYKDIKLFENIIKASIFLMKFN